MISFSFKKKHNTTVRVLIALWIVNKIEKTPTIYKIEMI